MVQVSFDLISSWMFMEFCCQPFSGLAIANQNISEAFLSFSQIAEYMCPSRPNPKVHFYEKSCTYVAWQTVC